MGLDSAALGTDGVQRAVRLRAEQCGLSRLEDYTSRVRESGEELQTLVEALVVSETWFFRHIEAFQTLVEWIQTDWLSMPRDRELRILSLPCSTGEEPYSIAMALLDAGLSREQVFLDAMDISRPSLAEAAKGVYRDNSFRSAHLSFRDRYFTQQDGGFRIANAVREMVQFRPGNIFSPDLSAGRTSYDVIFCRNVLIYFSHQKQREAAARLGRMLEPSGLLFTGPAEGSIMIECGLAAVPQRMSFGFRLLKESTLATEPGFSKPRGKRPLQKPAMVHSKVSPLTHYPAQSPAQAPVPPANTSIPDLANAREHADAGRLNEAEAICVRLAGNPKVNADVYALLGVVQDALGRSSDAEESYRRAIYLDPTHHQALVHLALLADRRNDFNAARRLRDRARRSEEAR